MPRQELKPVSFIEIDAPWIAEVSRLAGSWVYEHHRNCIDFVPQLPARYPCLVATGNIKPHTDPEFEPWSYLLILTDGMSPVLKAHGHLDQSLQRGMLVELNVHRRHSLRQTGTGSSLLFSPLDSEERLDLEEAMRRHEEKAHLLLQASAGAQNQG